MGDETGCEAGHCVQEVFAAPGGESSHFPSAQILQNSTSHPEEMGNFLWSPGPDSGASVQHQFNGAAESIHTASTMPSSISQTEVDLPVPNGVGFPNSVPSQPLKPFQEAGDHVFPENDVSVVSRKSENFAGHNGQICVPIKTMEDLTRAMLEETPSSDVIKFLTREAQRLGQRLKPAARSTGVQLERDLLTQTYHFLTATLQLEDVFPTERLHFFYSVLWLTKHMVELTMNEEGLCGLRRRHEVLKLYAIFWTRTIPETSEFCREVTQQLQESFKENVPVAILMLVDLEVNILRLWNAQKESQNTAKTLVVSILLLNAKCFLTQHYYEDANRCCKDILDKFSDYDNERALELWALALHRQGKVQLALDKASRGLNVARRPAIRDRLSRLVIFLREEQMAECERESRKTKTFDPAWLEGTNALRRAGSETCLVQGRTRSKSRHRRPKARQQNDSQRSQSVVIYQRKGRGIITLPVTRMSSNQMPGASSFPVTSLPSGELSEGESSGSEVESLSSEEPAVRLDLEFFKKQRQPSQLPQSTWFEDSTKEDEPGGKSKKKKMGLNDFVEMDVLNLHEREVVEMYEERSALGKRLYPETKTKGQLQHLLSTQPERYKHCKLKIASAHSATCRVISDTGDNSQQIEISGRSKVGRTFNDDEVAVEILAGKDSSQGPVFGKVVGILQRHRYDGVPHPVLACVIDQYESQLMHPLCKTVPKIHVLNPKLKHRDEMAKRNKVEIFEVAEDGTLKSLGIRSIPAGRREEFVFRVGIIHWGQGDYYPLGVVVGMMEAGKNFASGLRVLELQHAVHKKYSSPCVQRVNGLGTGLTPDLRRGREDLTQRLTFTIDPAGSRDLDDALSVWEEGKVFVVGVHIADVTSLVERGDAVDVEARRRGCTFYPPGGWRPYPMLPEPLSHGRCSLLAGQPRPALSLLFRLDSQGRQQGQPEIFRSLVRSHHQLTYAQVQDIIDGKNKGCDYPEPLVKAVRKLNDLAVSLRWKRLGGAARHHQYEDSRLNGREEDGALEAHALVEEFMVRTNTHIAQRLHAKFPTCTLLRSQDAPCPDEIRKWLETGGAACHFLAALQDRVLPLGTKLSAKEFRQQNTEKSLELQYVSVRRDVWHRLLTALENEDMEEVTRVLSADDHHPKQQLTFVRWAALQEYAVYRCSNAKTEERNNDLDGPGNGHFSLGEEVYTHFTSPIRRYADMMVHRMVKAVLIGRSNPYEREEVRELVEEINRCNELAKAFDRHSRDLHLADRLLERPLQVTAVVGAVSDQGLDLLISGMRSPPHTLRDMPFNLLTLCQQPVVENGVVRCQWRRRVFHTLGNVSHKVRKTQDAHRKQLVQVNERHLVVDVSARRWGRLLEAFFSSKEGRLKSMQEVAGRISPEGERSQFPGSRNNISCESGDGQLATQVVRFERTFAPGQAVHVQLSSGCEKGMLIPRVGLLWVSDNLHLCLEHVRDPVAQLAAHAQKSFTPAASLTGYVRTWIPLLKMEAVTACAQETAGVLVEHVEVAFNRQRGGTFSLPYEFCAARSLDLGGQPVHRIRETPMRVSTCTEYLCIRVPVEDEQSQKSGSSAKASSMKKEGARGRQKGTGPQGSQSAGLRESVLPEMDRATPTARGWIWVGHGHTTSVCRKNKELLSDRVEVSFELNESGAPPPASLLATPTVTGLVEILPVAETERRAVGMLEELERRETMANEKGGHPAGKRKTKEEEEKARKERQKKIGALKLVQAIALRTGVPELDEDRLDLGRRIEKDLNRRQTVLPENNHSQQEAIATALTSTFSLIQGPPGTGKTYTGLKLIYLFHKINSIRKDEGAVRKQVLFCGPSNKSVDVVAKLAVKHLKTLTPCAKVARMYGKSIEEQDFPVPGKDIWRKGGRDGGSDVALRDVTIHFLIRRDGKPYATEIKKYDAMFNLSKGRDPTEMASHVKRYNKLVAKATVEELALYDVIFCTCSVAGNRKLVEATDIFQVIIDECGMSPEPHCLVPIIANCARQVVLIGDHKQLRPIIRNRDAADMGLEVSMFERFALSAKFLDTQYRMNPRLCDFPSETFYGGKLLTGKSRAYHVDQPLSLWPNPDCPHVLVHVEGEERVLTVSTEEGNEMSRSNDAEVDKVVQIVQRMVGPEHVDRRSINVMSQYNAQCHQLRQKLMEQKLADVKVSTVVASQGGEWDYVIFSTVRSLSEAQIEESPTRGWSQRHLGFITDQNQINVALTRARKGLIIVGNTTLLEKDPVLEKLMRHYKSRGCLVDGEHFPPPVKRFRSRQVQPTDAWQTIYRGTAP